MPTPIIFAPILIPALDSDPAVALCICSVFFMSNVDSGASRSKPRSVFRWNSFIAQEWLHLTLHVPVRCATVSTLVIERLWHLVRRCIDSQIFLGFTNVFRWMKRDGTVLRFALESPIDVLRHRRQLYRRKFTFWNRPRYKTFPNALGSH